MRQPEFLLVSRLGLALNLDRAPSVHRLRPRPIGPTNFVLCFLPVPRPDSHTVIPAPNICPDYNH